MEIAYIFNSVSETSGDSKQAERLKDKIDGLIPVAKSPRKIPSDLLYIEEGGVVYPTDSLEETIKSIDPDFIFYNCLSDNVYKMHQELKNEYPSIYRMSANLIEQSIVQGYDTKIGYFISFLKSVDVINPPSRYLKDNLESLGYKNVSDPIPPTVNFDKLKKIRDNVDNFNNNIIVTISRYSGIKNLHQSCILMDKVLQDYPNLKYQIYGDENIRALENTIQSLSCRDRIELHKPEPAWKILSRAKLYLQLSISENHSTTVAESSIAGIPVVTSSSKGMKGRALLKTDIENWQMVIDTIKNLLEDKEKYDCHSNPPLSHLQKYKPENVIKQYKELFDKVKNLQSYKEGILYNL